jgi:GNAT superfamily N-acetyltransferase
VTPRSPIPRPVAEVLGSRGRQRPIVTLGKYIATKRSITIFPDYLAIAIFNPNRPARAAERPALGDDVLVTSGDLGSGAIVRRAAPTDAVVVAELLDDFNTEFATPTPGRQVLESRLDELLGGDQVVVLLVGVPAAGLAVLTFRPNVWFDGPVAILDELYVRPELRGRRLGSALISGVCDLVRGRGGELIEVNVDGDDTAARRFYAAHGFTNHEADRTDPLLYYYRELSATADR